MKLITKLQSYTDVITNSSSTVFIMKEGNAEWYKKDVPYNCCKIELIDEQWLIDNMWEWELVFEFLGIDKSIISEEVEGYHHSYWEDIDEDAWRLWIDNNLSLLQEKLFGLYFVEIEDHFENAYEYISDVKSDALYSDDRH